MKSHFFLLSVLAACLAVPAAQAAAPAAAPAPELPPLAGLIERALRVAPKLETQQALIDKSLATLERQKKAWMDNVGANLSYVQGSYGEETLDRLSTGLTAGISLRVSLFDLFGRKHDRDAFRAEHRVSIGKLHEAEEEIRIEVIRIYRKLDFARRLVLTRNEAAEATAVHLELAEAQFAQGDLPIAELARVTEIAAKSRADAEQARSEYLTAWAELEVRVGGPLVLPVPGQP